MIVNEIDIFKQAIRFVHPGMTDEEIEFFTGGTHVRSVKARAYFIETDKVHKEIGFVVQGLVRGFYIDDEGNEITTRLIKEGGFATHYKAFLLQEPSKYYFQCLEDTVFVCFEYDHVQQAYEKYPAIERFGRLIAEEVIKILESRTEAFQFNDATERYLAFMRHQPDLHNRVSLSHLSSYLGIARPSLSRIRKKISESGSL